MIQKTKRAIFRAVFSYTAHFTAAIFISISAIAQENNSDTSRVVQVNLNEVILQASFVKERQSPLRLTTIDRLSIEKKAAGVTYPQLLENIPGVYATSESGSYGDAKINIRGFKQENISVLLNGIPISGLVTGNMFWNNWLGLTDATHSIQVQKGIGASMLSDNSVGGTINIITKTPSLKRAANAGYFITDYGMQKAFAGFSTGLGEGGWASSLQVSYAWGESYPVSTKVSSWAYIFNLSKNFGKRHSILLTALGSPERHEQRSARLSAKEVETYGLKYNKNWGYLYGKPKNISENFYHKPYITLHHFFKISEKTDLSNALYISSGNGGGRWSESKGKRILDYRKEGLIDWDSVVAENRNISQTTDASLLKESGSARNILTDYLAGHTQVGFKSNLSVKVGEYWNLNSGFHYQYYYTWERERITDLLGGLYWYENYQTSSLAGLSGRNPIKRIGDYVRTNNGKYINHLTVYSLANYKKDDWDIRVGSSVMAGTNQRWDRYNYIDDIYSKTATAAGFSLKGGANKKLTAASSVYLNGGYYSRLPYNDVFFSSGNNNLTEDVKNEKNILVEGGFRHLFQRGYIEVTLYYAYWKNKSVMSNPYKQPDNTNLRYLIRGLDALHRGFELNASYKPYKFAELSAYLSLGDWRWKNDVSANIYDDYSGNLKEVVNIYSNGLPVGDSPQNQLFLAADISILKNLSITAEWRYNGRMYADFEPRERQNSQDRANPYRIPSYNITNLSFNWRSTKKTPEVALFMNIGNIFNETYIERGRDGAGHTYDSFRGFWGMGRNLSAGVRFGF